MSFYQFLKSFEVTKFRIRRKLSHTHECTKRFIPGFLCKIFVNFMEKEQSFTKFYFFKYFSRTYEATKFWIIELCLDVSDVIHTNKHTQYANSGLLYFLEFLVNIILLFFGLRSPKDMSCNVVVSKWIIIFQLTILMKGTK